MAPKDSHLGKRVKLTSVRRPFVYGTTARPFGPGFPKPPGVPEGHTHSWEVFVRGIDPDVDVTYWLRRVQFKLHESIANHVRSRLFGEWWSPVRGCFTRASVCGCFTRPSACGCFTRPSACGCFATTHI
jgi:hypothetical protein